MPGPGFHTKVIALVINKIIQKNHPLTSKELFDLLEAELPNPTVRNRKAHYNAFRNMLSVRDAKKDPLVWIEDMGYWPAELPFDLSKITHWTQTRTTPARIKAEVPVIFLAARRHRVDILTVEVLHQRMQARGVAFARLRPFDMLKKCLREMVEEGGLVEVSPNAYRLVFVVPQVLPTAPVKRQVAHA
jgi:hypothetical protein